MELHPALAMPGPDDPGGGKAVRAVPVINTQWLHESPYLAMAFTASSGPSSRHWYSVKTTCSEAARQDSPDTQGRTCVGGGSPRSRCIGLLRPQLLQESLCGRPIGLRGIAGLTAGDHIPLDAPPATRERDHMIHGQGVGGEGALAVGTDTAGNAIPPPLRLA